MAPLRTWRGLVLGLPSIGCQTSIEPAYSSNESNRKYPQICQSIFATTQMLSALRLSITLCIIFRHHQAPPLSFLLYSCSHYRNYSGAISLSLIPILFHIVFCKTRVLDLCHNLLSMLVYPHHRPVFGHFTRIPDPLELEAALGMQADTLDLDCELVLAQHSLHRT